MNTRLITFSLVVLCGSAFAQPKTEPMKNACRRINGAMGQSGDDWDTWAHQILSEATGSKADEEEQVVRERVKALFKERLKKGPREPGFFCDNVVLGYETTLLGFAVWWSKWNEVHDLVRLGVDPSWVDPKSGKTALDEYLEKVQTLSENENRATSPYKRGTPEDVVESGGHYWKLRELGLRHAWELTQPSSPLCPASAEDAPAPGVPFTGELSEDGNGETPQEIPGVKTVSAWQTGCLINTFKDKLVRIAAMPVDEAIPGSYSVGWAGSGGTYDDKVQAAIETVARTLTLGGEGYKGRPILVYCHHVKCRLSYNALLRLKHAGFTQLYWLRNGTKEWKAKGMTLAPVVKKL